MGTLGACFQPKRLDDIEGMLQPKSLNHIEGKNLKLIIIIKWQYDKRGKLNEDFKKDFMAAVLTWSKGKEV